MAFSIQGPNPNLQVTLLLPNPSFGDSVAPTSSLDLKRSMTGIKYVYIRAKDLRKKLIWQFSLSEAKAAELQQYFDNYTADEALITDHNGDAYVGFFTINPFDFEGAGNNRGGQGGDTRISIQLQFEGIKQ